MPRRDPRLDVDIRKQRPNRPVFAPHRSPHESSRQPGNHAKHTNTSDFSSDFFSSLLEGIPSRLLRKLQIVYIESEPPPKTSADGNDDAALGAQRRKT